MLKNALSELLEKVESGKSRDCKLCKLVSEQDPDTAEVIIKTLQSNAPTRSIARAFNAEGFAISREYLGEKRKTCFKNPNAKCGLLPQESDK